MRKFLAAFGLAVLVAGCESNGPGLCLQQIVTLRVDPVVGAPGCWEFYGQASLTPGSWVLVVDGIELGAVEQGKAVCIGGHGGHTAFVRGACILSAPVEF